MTNAAALIRDPERIIGTVAIFYYGRSGSFLLGSMLDGHSRVLAVPPHTINFFFETLAPKLRGEFELETVASHICVEFPDLFVETQTAGSLFRGEKKDLPIGVERQVFKTRLIECLSHEASKGSILSSYSIFRAVHIAYAAANGKTISESGPLWIVWQAHSQRDNRKKWLEELIPNVHYLNIVRYPEKTADSYIQHYLVDYPGPEPEASLGKAFPHIFVHDQAQFTPDRSPRGATVRFEDLHNKTDEVMQFLADWLSLEWNPILLESTLDSEALWQPSGGKLLHGTSLVTSDRMRSKNLSLLDRLKLRHVMRETYREWGYSTGRQVMLPTFIIEKLLWCIPSRVFFKSIIFHFKNCWRADRDFHAEMLKERHSRNTKPPKLLKLKAFDQL